MCLDLTLYEWDCHTKSYKSNRHWNSKRFIKKANFTSLLFRRLIGPSRPRKLAHNMTWQLLINSTNFIRIKQSLKQKETVSTCLQGSMSTPWILYRISQSKTRIVLMKLRLSASTKIMEAVHGKRKRPPPRLYKKALRCKFLKTTVKSNPQEGEKPAAFTWSQLSRLSRTTRWPTITKKCSSIKSWAEKGSLIKA